MKISFAIIALVSAQRPFKITNIIDMANAVLRGPNGFGFLHGINYGCAGRGRFNPFRKTEGKPVDTADRAFFTWKKCVQCAAEWDPENVQPYDYDRENDSCGKLLLFC